MKTNKKTIYLESVKFHLKKNNDDEENNKKNGELKTNIENR
jgi:hypothetical protein